MVQEGGRLPSSLTRTIMKIILRSEMSSPMGRQPRTVGMGDGMSNFVQYSNLRTIEDARTF